MIDIQLAQIGFVFLGVMSLMLGLLGTQWGNWHG